MTRPARRVGPGSAAAVRVPTARETCRDGAAGHPLERCRVLTRRGNYSAFGGGRWQPSEWSAVVCTACWTVWRTRASYVDGLPDA